MKLNKVCENLDFEQFSYWNSSEKFKLFLLHCQKDRRGFFTSYSIERQKEDFVYGKKNVLQIEEKALSKILSKQPIQVKILRTKDSNGEPCFETRHIPHKQDIQYNINKGISFKYQIGQIAYSFILYLLPDGRIIDTRRMAEERSGVSSVSEDKITIKLYNPFAEEFSNKIEIELPKWKDGVEVSVKESSDNIIFSRYDDAIFTWKWEMEWN